MLYATRAAEKLREQQSRCRHISVSIATGRHGNEPQYSNTASRICDYPKNDTRDFIVLALGGLSSIWREGDRYAKAGVMLGDFYQSGVTQYDMFSEQQPRAKQDALMSAPDRINRSGRSRVWFAGQGARHSRWQMKSEMLPPRYTTRLSDITLIR